MVTFFTGLNIEENESDVNSGLFRDQQGEVRNLVLINPEVVARGNGTYQGLVAGENSGKVTGIVWQGGRMEHEGGRTGSDFRNFRDAYLGVVGRNNAGGQVQFQARSVTQTATGYSASIGIGAGYNNGTVQGVAQSVTQTATGSYADIGIAAGYNNGKAQGMAQNVTQTATGHGANIGIAAGYNNYRSTAQAVAQSVTQTATRDYADIGIGAGHNYRATAQGVAQAIIQNVTGNHADIGIGAGHNYRATAQGVAQNVTQAVTGDRAKIGIGTGDNTGFYAGSTAQGVAQNVTQSVTGNYAYIGIGAGYNDIRSTAQGMVQDVIQSVTGSYAYIGIGAGYNNYGSTARGKLLTEADKSRKLTQLGLITKQEDWTTGNTTQFPMLKGLGGGYQDMQRLSSEFKQAMRDYAPPSNNPNASWFESIVFPGNCPALMGKPLYQAMAGDYFYVVAYQEASQSLLLIRYNARNEWDQHFGTPFCWHRQNLMQGLESATIDSGVLHGNTLYLAANNPGYQSQLLALPLESGLMREVSIPANVYGLQVWENRLYLTGTTGDGSVFFLSSKALPLTESSENASISDLDGVGYSLLANSDGTIYVAGQSGSFFGDLMIRRFRASSLQPIDSFGDNGMVLDPLAEPGTKVFASRGRAMVLHDGRLYVAGNLKAANGEDLFIRRYSLSGELDEDFKVMVATGLNEAGLNNLSHEVYLQDSGAYLTVVKRVLDDNQAYIASVGWDSGDIVDEQRPVFDGMASARGLGLGPDDQLRMAVHQDGQVRVEREALSFSTATSVTQSELGPVVGGVTGTFVAVAAVAGIVVGGACLVRRYLIDPTGSSESSRQESP